MAKPVIQQFIIQAQKAVDALKNVTASTNQYNAALRRSQQLQQQLNQQSIQLRNQMSNVAKSFSTTASNANQATKSVHSLSQAFKLASAVAAITVLHRSFSALVSEVRNSVSAAQELQVRIAEVQTVSLEFQGTVLKTAKSVNTWSKEMLALSANMGIPVAQQAEAAYNALSDQVVKAGEVTRFMGSEMKLAITAVSSLSQATKITDTVINAYKKNAADAEKINATLFRGIDLGRFRLDELGSSFGRVAILSHTLGVSFEEQIGALVQLTNLGLEADVANTLMVNVMNSLIKPTKEMTALFNQWGVGSAEAAISTFGLAGVIEKLAIEVDKSNSPLTEIAKHFEDLRAVTGGAALVANFRGLRAAIVGVTDATLHYNTAFKTVMENLGQRGRVQLEKFNQFFLLTFGIKAQELLVTWAERMGGADKAMNTLVATLGRGVVIYGSYKALTLLLNSGLTQQGGLLSKVSKIWQEQTAIIAANAAAQKAAQVANIDQERLKRLHFLMASNKQHSGILINLALLQQQANTASRSAAAALQAQTVATNAASAATTSMVAAEAAATIGLTLLIAAIAEVAISWASMRSNLVGLAHELQTLELEKLRKSFEKFGETLDTQAANFKKDVNSLTGQYLKTVSDISRLNNILLSDVESKYGAIHKAMSRAFKLASKEVSEHLSKLKKDVTAAESAVKDGLDAITKLRSDARDRAIDGRIRGPGRAGAEAIERERIKLHEEATKALADGDLKLAEDLFAKFDKLGELAVDKLRKAKDEALKISEDVKEKVKVGTITAGTGGITASGPGGRVRLPASVRRRLGLPAITAKADVVEDIAPRDDVRIPARNEAKRIEEDLLRLAKERTIEEEKREALLEKFVAKKREETELAKKAEADAEEASERFAAALADLDAFKPSKKGEIPAAAESTELTRILNEARASGKTLGLSGGDLTLALREGAKLKVELDRKAEADITKNNAEELAKRIDQARDALTKSNDDKVTLQKKAEDEAGKAIAASKTTSVELRDIARATTASDQTGGQAARALEILKEIRVLEDADEPVKNIGALTNKYKELAKVLEDVEKLKAAALGLGDKEGGPRDVFTALGLPFGAGRLDKDTKGRSLLPSDKSVTLAQAAKERIEQLEKASKAIADAEKARSVLLIKTQQELQTQIDELGKAYKVLALDVEVSGDKSIEKQKELNKLLLEQLEIIKLIQANQANAAAAGGIAAPIGEPSAHGRVGIDSQLTPTAYGESVMNRLATRQYAPMLRMMNGATPQFNNGGNNSNMNIADINIYMPQGSTTMQANKLAGQLNRLHRQSRY